jgi:hypothetical protein
MTDVESELTKLDTTLKVHDDRLRTVEVSLAHVEERQLSQEKIQSMIRNDVSDIKDVVHSSSELAQRTHNMIRGAGILTGLLITAATVYSILTAS